MCIRDSLTGVQIDFGKSMLFTSDTFINLNGGADVVAYKAGFGGTAVQTISFNKNFIDSLNSTGVSSVAEGLKVTTGTSNFTNSCSFINGVIKRVRSSGTSATASAITTTGGTTSYSFTNNMLSDINAPNNTSSYSSAFGFNIGSTCLLYTSRCV